MIVSLGLLIPVKCVQAGFTGPSNQCLSAHLVKLTRTEKIPLQHNVVFLSEWRKSVGWKGLFSFVSRMMQSSQENCSS